jgi:hypothetical protein
MIRLGKLVFCLVGAIAMLGMTTMAMAGSVTYPPEAATAHDMKLVGWYGLEGRPAYHPHIQQQGERWILYVSEHVTVSDGTKTYGPKGNGTSIIDVTDPTKPVLLKHLTATTETDPGSEARSMRVCERNNRFWMIRQMPKLGYEIWDVTTPEKPEYKLTIADKGQTNTHKINWECDTDARGRSVAYLPWRTKGDEWRGVYLRIYDLADPTHPVFIRNYGRPGLEPGSESLYPNAPSGVHHTGLDPERKRVYVNYSCCGTGAWQILDRSKLLDGDPSDMAAPSRGIWDAPDYLGVHSTYALPGLVNPELAVDKLTDAEKHRDYAIVIGEAGGNGCNRQRQLMQVWDATQDFKAWVVSGFQVPAATGDFCSKGGRFGPHGSNEQVTHKFHNKMIGVSYFNAGIRMIDIRQPFWPREVAYFIPRPNQNTFYCDDGCAPVIQTNNVEMDERGYIYIVDRAGTGMHILELTGDAKKIIE